MTPRSSKCLTVLVAVVALAMLTASRGAASTDAGLADFEKVHALIKPQGDESRWRQIPWLTSVWEARQLAAREGKPIFLWAGSGGGPAGVC